MRILITGASGQVGRALSSSLEGYDLTALDRQGLDLADHERIGAVLDQVGPELIINPAAYTDVDQAESEREQAHLINAVAPGSLALWARDNGAPIIHFSTDYVFDGSGTRPWSEDDPKHPLSVYGATKLAGEAAVRSMQGDHLIIRTSWVYAARATNFFHTIARRALEQTELRVVADQIGAPTPAALIADTVKAMLEDGLDAFREKCARAGGVVHAASSGTTSWHGFATAIVEGLKVRGVDLAVRQIHPVDSADYPTRARRPHNSRLELGRLKAVFGVGPVGWVSALQPELDILARAISQPSSMADR
jgi:dTDP-4-dehydrorhamnose reductase